MWKGIESGKFPRAWTRFDGPVLQALSASSFEADQPQGSNHKLAVEKSDGVFKVAVLYLKMMWTEVHAL